MNDMMDRDLVCWVTQYLSLQFLRCFHDWCGQAAAGVIDSEWTSHHTAQLCHVCHVSRGRGPGDDVSRLWSLGHGAHFCKIFARDEQVIFIFNSLIFCTWHQWTDNLRTAIIMKGSKSWSASHCINYVCNSFQQFRVWKYCVEISSTRTCARVLGYGL